MPRPAQLLARGPWRPEDVEVSWRSEIYELDPRANEQADQALRALGDRGSPTHDGLAARLAQYEAGHGKLQLVLQPARWALRLSPQDARNSFSALCIVRAADGSWLAGRRAEWLASWAGRWALGAGGSVEVDEHPADTLGRELREEWSVEPERLTIEALIGLDNGMVLLVGQAWLAAGAKVTPDHEHDAFAWWPAEVQRWPAEADAVLRRMGTMLA